VGLELETGGFPPEVLEEGVLPLPEDLDEDVLEGILSMTWIVGLTE